MRKPLPNPRDWDTRGTLERHPLADQQPLEIRHMCPDCGGRGGLCPVCLGVGTVDTDRLEAHNAALWAEANGRQPGRIIIAEPI